MSRAQYSASAQSPEQSSPAPVGIGRRRVLTRFAPAVAGLGVAVLLVGCGAGQITQTDTQQSAVNGGSGQVGAIAIRNAELQWPDNPQGVFSPGSNATLIVTIANTGIDPDELIGVSSPAASSVTIDGSETGTKPLPGNFSIVSGVDVDDSTEDVPLPSTTYPAADQHPEHRDLRQSDERQPDLRCQDHRQVGPRRRRRPPRQRPRCRPAASRSCSTVCAP